MRGTFYRIDPNSGYDEMGHLLGSLYGNGVEESYEYYPLSKRLKKTLNLRTSSEPGGGGNSILRDLEYQYNARGNLRSILDRLNSGVHQSSLENITYDDLERITGYQHHQGELEGLAFAGFRYDSVGNMLRNTESFGDEGYVYGDRSHPHAVSSIGAESFGYDAIGNMTSGRGRQMGYDGANRLSRVQLTNGRVVEYGYGGLGERLLKRVSGTGGESATYYFGNYLEVTDG